MQNHTTWLRINVDDHQIINTKVGNCNRESQKRWLDTVCEYRMQHSSGILDAEATDEEVQGRLKAEPNIDDAVTVVPNGDEIKVISMMSSGEIDWI